MEKTAAVPDEDYDKLFQLEKAAEAFGTGIVEDPYPIWADLLAEAPVHPGTLSECMGLPPERSGLMYVPGMMFHSVFSFEAVSDVFLRKDDFGSDIYNDIGALELLGDNILSMDGLRHRRYRDLVQPMFQPAAANSWWRKPIEDLVDEFLSGFDPSRPIDLNAALFSRLPMHTIIAGFGLTLEEGLVFREQLHLANNVSSSKEVQAEGNRQVTALLYRLIENRQAEPQDDIISRLAHADLQEDDGTKRKLTVEEVAGYCRQILTAGSDTTWRQMGTALFALLNHPEQLQAVMKDPSLIGSAVLEATRWYPPDPLFPRKVLRDTVLCGVELPAGSALHLCVSAANRDPARWEDPDRYDIFRPVQRSVAFGAGSHSCLGQHVSRREMTLALTALFERFPNIRWDPDKPAARLTGGLIQRGPTELHVLLD